MKKKVSFVDKNRERFNVKIEVENGRFSMSSDNGQHRFVPANEPQEKLLALWNNWHLNDMKAGTPKQAETIDKYDVKSYDEVVELLSSLKPDGTPISVIEQKVLDKKKKIVLSELKTLETKTQEFEKAVEKFQKTRGSVGWFLFDFESVGFEHPKIQNTFGKKDNPGIYVELYGAIKPNHIFTRIKEHLEQREAEIQKMLNPLLLATLLYDMHEGKPYRYGTAWLKKALPEDIEEQINTIVSEVIAAEKERNGEDITTLPDGELITLIEEETSFSDRDAELAAAFVKMFSLSKDDLGDIEINGSRCTVQGIDYTAGNEEEVTEAVTEDIKQSLWAFNASFLATQTGLPQEVFTALQPQCEGANDAIEAIIDREPGIDEFVAAAVRADGRAHFLNRYDGTELSAVVNGTQYYAYRN